MIFILAVLIVIIALFVWLNAAKKVRQNDTTFRSVRTASLLAMGVAAILALTQCFTQVPAGHVGVVDLFGIVSKRTLPAGINFVNPLARVIKFSIQTKEHKETMEVL